MSDISVLWHDYERYQRLAMQVTEDVIALKRQQFDLPGRPRGSALERAEQEEASRAHLRDFVARVIAALAPEDSDLAGENELREPLPQAWIERLRGNVAGVQPRFLSDLRELHERLSQPGAELEPLQIGALESLSGSIHTQTSRVFRRLWRK